MNELEKSRNFISELRRGFSFCIVRTACGVTLQPQHRIFKF